MVAGVVHQLTTRRPVGEAKVVVFFFSANLPLSFKSLLPCDVPTWHSGNKKSKNEGAML